MPNGVEQVINIPMVLIIGAVISIVGFIIVTLMGIISAGAFWFLNRWITTQDKEKAEQKVEHEKLEADNRRERLELANQMKSDRDALLIQMKADRDTMAVRVDNDKQRFDERVEKAAQLFGAQVKSVAQEFMAEIKEVKTTINNLSTIITNLVTSGNAVEKRIDQLHLRIEDVSTRGHSSDTYAQGLSGKIQVNAQKIEDEFKKQEEIRAAGYKRLEFVEKLVQNVFDNNNNIDEDDEGEEPSAPYPKRKFKKKTPLKMRRRKK